MNPEDELLAFNGINGTTGKYLFDRVSLKHIAQVFKGGKIDPDELEYIRTIEGSRAIPYFGSVGLEEHLALLGWGIVFATTMENFDAILAALEPLMAHRQQQVKPERFKKLAYIKDKDTLHTQWLARNGAGPGTVNPEIVPYYLLLVGSPEDIPFKFQFDLDIEYAVGRIHFDTVEEYAKYAQQLVATETRDSQLNKEAVFFSVKNNLDKATEASSQHLIQPLYQAYTQTGRSYFSKQLPVRRIENQAASKANFGKLLQQDKLPAFVFTASHGMGFALDDARLEQDQGALLCSDWPGVHEWSDRPIPPDFYFAAADIPPDTNLQGMMLFLFGCFSGGTPKYDNFLFQATGEGKQIAPRDFISALPKRLLTAGASALIAHIDRAWESSFLGELKTDNTVTIQGVIDRLFAGLPIGDAMQHLNDYYAAMSSQMGSIQESLRETPDYLESANVSDYVLARIYIAKNDARNYIVLGDPMARLKPVSL